jgi:hypothetical protein
MTDINLDAAPPSFFVSAKRVGGGCAVLTTNWRLKMVEEFKPKLVKDQPDVADAADIGGLFISGGGDPITEQAILSVPIGKPREFFRTHPDPACRRHVHIYIHEPEGTVEKQFFIVSPAMVGLIDEARLCQLVLLVDRAGLPRFWPVGLPKEGGHDIVAWQTAREVVRCGIYRWVRPVWVKRAYVVRFASEGYAPDPDWTKLPPYDDLVKRAFGEHGIIRNEEHYIYKSLGETRSDALG